MKAKDRSDSLTWSEQTGPVATCRAAVEEASLQGGCRYRSRMKLTGRSDDELLTKVWSHRSADQTLVLGQSFEDENGDDGRRHHVGGEAGREFATVITPAPNRYGDGAALCSS